MPTRATVSEGYVDRIEEQLVDAREQLKEARSVLLKVKDALGIEPELAAARFFDMKAQRDEAASKLQAEVELRQDVQKHRDHCASKILDRDETIKALEGRLSAYRNRSIDRGELGSMCRLCKGTWSHTRGAEWHEPDCPNNGTVVERRDTVIGPFVENPDPGPALTIEGADTCVAEGCEDSRRDGSNYCERHGPEHWPRKRRP